MTDAGEESWETREFNLIWSNDQAIYRAVVDFARECLRVVPGMTDQTLGLNVKHRVFSWAYGGGWGYSHGWLGTRVLVGPDRDLIGPWAYFLPRGAFGKVSKEAVGANVRDALGVESIQ